MPKYEYDVAISFLAQDEGVAAAIHDELSERLRVFLYSKQQEDLAGAEGDQAFAATFRGASRVVVVLYRPGWGETPWTRVEMNAIRSRALECGWGFCLMVPLETSKVPDYVPHVNIWYDIATYGTKPLPAIVARMAQEHGAEVGRDDAVERAGRLARLEQFRLQRNRFRGSLEGVELMRQSFESMCDRISVLVNEISERTNGAMLFTVKGPTGSKTNVDREFAVIAMNVGLLGSTFARDVREYDRRIYSRIFYLCGAPAVSWRHEVGQCQAYCLSPIRVRSIANWPCVEIERGRWARIGRTITRRCRASIPHRTSGGRDSQGRRSMMGWQNVRRVTGRSRPRAATARSRDRHDG